MAEGMKVPHILHLDGLVFPVPGRYSFDVRVDGEHHTSVPLTVAGVPGAIPHAGHTPLSGGPVAEA
jgi:hypothetical protein